MKKRLLFLALLSTCVVSCGPSSETSQSTNSSLNNPTTQESSEKTESISSNSSMKDNSSERFSISESTGSSEHEIEFPPLP